ncbi:t-SNARE affecting a late Golgi compartment protein 2 [Blastocladiella emersonii ATCC 22665]|nr:t-SNARE affecting a late Golgi compartment protein 2 [Blastocladiella emersonii ATCC 22665]
MATRSRTTLFIELRRSVPRQPAAGRSGRGGALESEKVGLISEPHTAVDVGHIRDLPPAWVDTVEEIESTIDRIQQQLNNLETLQKKHLLPGFDDRSDTEASIDAATHGVTTMFKQCQKQIKAFEANHQAAAVAARKRGAPMSQQELKLHQNVTSSLAARVSTLSTQFRKGQSNYVSRLKNRSAKASPLFSLSDTEDEESGGGGGGTMSSAFTDQQVTQVAQNEDVIRTREREIEEIAKTMTEIAELFRDMHTMVIDQGSLLDRIDYHLEVAATNVEKGNEELDKAVVYQASARKKMLIYLLCLAILFVILLLAIKRR